MIVNLKKEKEKIDTSGFSYTASSSSIHQRRNFFPSCVDNFFDEPDLIREFALSLDMKPSEDGSWPGLRSKSLHEIDNELHQNIFLKILSVYYDLKYADISWGSGRAFFQSIPKYKGSDSINKGWIHMDNSDELAGLVYLTPNANPDSGTSLFKLKDEFKETYVPFARSPDKHNFYTDRKITDKNYIKSLEKHNNQFVETVRFQNVYNRLITYDANELHKANSFECDQSRLTLVFFIRDIKNDNIKRSPLNRVQDKFNFDSQFEKQINNYKGE